MKVYINTHNCLNLNLILELESTNYQLCDNIKQADIIIGTCQTGYPEKSLVIIDDLWNGFENGHTNYNELANSILSSNKTCRLLILSQYHSFPEIKFDNNRVHLLKYDIMMNRQKAYYDQRPLESHFLHKHINWYWAGNQSYEINHWPRESQHRLKIFLAPMRIYSHRQQLFRKKIVECLQSYTDIGYVAKDLQPVDNNKSFIFYSHKEDLLSNGNLYFDIDSGQIEKTNLFITPRCISNGFAPVHVNYYENSFISIYGETLEYGDTIFVTEKTLNPLIQGHFVLPFSTCGFIRHLQKLGFKLPDFINYSYDNIIDDQDRFKSYIDEMHRLLTKPIEWWVDRRNENLDLLFYNRKLFWKIPYQEFLPFAKKILELDV